MGLFGAGPPPGPPPGPRDQLCCEEALLGHPAAAQAVLQASAWHLSPDNQALQEPGNADQLHLQRAVSRFPSLLFHALKACPGSKTI